jgi:hypothetical protein
MKKYCLKNCSIVLIALLVGVVQNSWSTDYIALGKKTYHNQCDCNDIFLFRHFDNAAPVDEHFSPNATQINSIAYGGTAACDQIIANSLIDYSYLTIPDNVVDCYMKGKLSRLTGYFKTNVGEFMLLSGEYTVGGVLKTLESTNNEGSAVWKQFEFFFDFTNITATITNVKLKVRAPVIAGVAPLYIDEVRLCSFCDGKSVVNGPQLSGLTVGPGALQSDFNPDNNYYVLKVPASTPTISVTPTISSSATISVRGIPVSSGSMVTVAIGYNQVTPVEITVKNSACDQTSYIVNVVNEDVIYTGFSILNPTYGDIYPVTGTMNIQWRNARKEGQLKFYLSTDGGVTWPPESQPFATVTQTDVDISTYSWAIPSTAVGQNCLIKVVNAETKSTLAISGMFKIIDKGFITPKNGTVWTSGSRFTMKWMLSGVGAVDIYYVKNGVEELINELSVTTAIASYEWLIPADVEGETALLLRIKGKNAVGGTYVAGATFDSEPFIIEKRSNFITKWFMKAFNK